MWIIYTKHFLFERYHLPYVVHRHHLQPDLFIRMVLEFRICAGCNAEIGHGRFLSCMGAVWHPECFRCRACNQPISDYEVQV